MRRRRASSSSSSSVPGVVGRAMPRDVLARAASPTVEDVENEDARLNFSGALSATDAGGVCVLEGMRSAAPAGAILTFESGTRAVLLSHREPKTFGLMYDVDSSGRKVIRDAANAVAPGERCEASKVEFMLGPSAGSTLGKVVDALGEIVGSNVAMVTGTVDSSRIMREPPSVEDRKPITTPLVTGIKAVDLLAPVGRGQCMLVSGEPGTGLSELGLTSIAAQKNTGVRCVYAALGAQASRVNEVTKRLEADGAMAHTTIVTCNTKAREGERYAATCTAFASDWARRALGAR
jgi:F0F1-type ATP synthase alpha subunit